MTRLYTLSLTYAEMREIDTALHVQQRELSDNKRLFSEALKRGSTIRKQIRNELKGDS